MKILTYALIKRDKLFLLNNNALQLSGQTTVVQNVIQLIQNKEWEDAISKSKLLANEGLAEDLISLIENQRELWTQEENRNWANTGLLEISKIISHNHTDIKKLANDLIYAIATYTKASQGVLFTINDNDAENIFLELTGCYAYQRKENLEKEYCIDEGLIGQSYKEGNPVYLTNLPPNYLKITSGLGAATPRCIMMIPLIGNKRKMGIVELAFFRTLQMHEREFIISVSESMANAIDNLQVNVKTLEMLKQSESMTSELKQKEEEMKQTVEEMRAIQESITRKNEELEKAHLEIESVTQREKELAESQIKTQQIINDKVINTLKLKVDKLQTELKKAKELKPLELESI